MMALAAPSAYAQKPTPAALLMANELAVTTGTTALFGPLIVGVIEQAKNLYLQQNPALATDLNVIVAQLRTEYAPRAGELTGHVATLYAEAFSEQELKDVLAFYKSAVGKKLLEQQPKIVDASLKYAQDWAGKLSDEVIAKMRDELKKKGHAL
ncbi:MAG: DUF2059 domain-containing protein [Rhodospirillales bacterium]